MIMLMIGCILALFEYKYQIEEVSGFWVIFVPFAPASVWAFYMYFYERLNTI